MSAREIAYRLDERRAELARIELELQRLQARRDVLVAVVKELEWAAAADGLTAVAHPLDLERRELRDAILSVLESAEEGLSAGDVTRALFGESQLSELDRSEREKLRNRVRTALVRMGEAQTVTVERTVVPDHRRDQLTFHDRKGVAG